MTDKERIDKLTQRLDDAFAQIKILQAKVNEAKGQSMDAIGELNGMFQNVVQELTFVAYTTEILLETEGEDTITSINTTGIAHQLKHHDLVTLCDYNNHKFVFEIGADAEIGDTTISVVARTIDSNIEAGAMILFKIERIGQTLSIDKT